MLDYARLADSDLFREYRSRAATLPSVDLARLSEAERKAFFLNLYNLMTVHALTVQDKVPDRAVDVKGKVVTIDTMISMLIY